MAARSARAGREVFLLVLLVSGTLALYLFREAVPEPRRLVLALAAAGFFFAPRSERRLRLVLWMPAVAAVAWIARWIGTAASGGYLWLACSVAGALLAIRGGGRAAQYYLPQASGEAGESLQKAIRRPLQGAVILYLAVYVADSWPVLTSGPGRVGRAFALLLAAVLLVRYLLLQGKHLGVPAVPLPRASGIVPAQRWPFLLGVALLGGTTLADRALPPVEGPLLVSAALLFVLSGLVFVLGLTRGRWARRFVRRASFVAGMVLALALAAAVVELEGLAPRRFGVFSALLGFFLVVLPFVGATTRLLEAVPHASELAPPPVLGVMMTPVTAVNGARWALPSSGLLFALGALTLAYWLLLALRSGGPLRLYLGASLFVMLFLALSDGAGWAESGSAWQMFLLALGCVLYSVDFFERAPVAGLEAP